MPLLVRAAEAGRITIPQSVRDELGIAENSLLELTVRDGELRIKPVDGREASAGSPWLRELYEHFAPVREEILRNGYTEQEVNDAIDQAFRAVRAEQRDPRDP